MHFHPLFLFMYFVLSTTSTPWTLLQSSENFLGVGNYGVPGQFGPDVIPGARRGHCVQSFGHRHFLYGGKGFGIRGSSNEIGDVWEFDDQVQEWRYLRGYPVAGIGLYYWGVNASRYGEFYPDTDPYQLVSAACWRSADRRFGIFAGEITSAGYIMSSMWEYDIDLNMWTRTRASPSLDGTNSTFTENNWYHAGHHMTATPLGGNWSQVLFFGGFTFNDAEPVNTVMEWSSELRMFAYRSGWRWPEEGSHLVDWPYPGDLPFYSGSTFGNFSIVHQPEFRGCHLAWSGSGDSPLFYIFGGMFQDSQNMYLNDLWAFNLSTLEWALLGGEWDQANVDPSIYSSASFDFSADNWPPARGFASGTYGSSSDLYVMAAGDEINGLLNDVWVYSTSRNQWKYVGGSLNVSVPQLSSLMASRMESVAFGSSNGKSIYFFAGFGTHVSTAELTMQDVWRLDAMPSECSRHGSLQVSGDVLLNSSLGVPSCRCDSANYSGDACESWECYGIERNLAARCEGHGVCEDVDQCVCDSGFDGFKCQMCSEGFFGYPNCEWACYEVSRLNSSYVCSGHGTCGNPNECDCQEGYDENDCSHFQCFGVEPSLLGSVCNAFGTCVAHDTCLCSSSYAFGEECSELIKSAIFYGEDGHIDISYVVPLAKIQKLTAESNCSDLVRNVGILGSLTPSSCRWSFGFHRTSRVHVDVGEDHAITSGAVLEMFVQTAATLGEVAMIPVTIFEEDDSAKLAEALAELSWLWVLLSLCCVFLVCVSAALFTIMGVMTYQDKKRLARLNQIEDVEFILAEQEASRTHSVARLRINKKLFEISYADVRLVKEIGSGGSGAKIYQATWKGQNVAFKVFNCRDLSNQTLYDDFEREVSMVSSMSHPNIIRFFGACLNPPRVGILTEYCSNGDLKDMMLRTREEGPEEDILTWHDRIRILAEIASALEYLHERDIIHRDLKANNVLLTLTLTAKVIDFGLSRIIKKGESGLTRQIGTSAYIAPELTLGTVYDSSVDVFSFGIVMFEILTENFDPYGTDTAAIELKVANSAAFRPNIDRYVTDGLITEDQTWVVGLMKRCWDHEASARPPFSELNPILLKRYDEIRPRLEGEDAAANRTSRATPRDWTDHLPNRLPSNDPKTSKEDKRKSIIAQAGSEALTTVGKWLRRLSLQKGVPENIDDLMILEVAVDAEEKPPLPPTHLRVGSLPGEEDDHDLTGGGETGYWGQMAEVSVEIGGDSSSSSDEQESN